MGTRIRTVDFTGIRTESVNTFFHQKFNIDFQDSLFKIRVDEDVIFNKKKEIQIDSNPCF